jgi:hypothetical protein
MLGIGFLLKLQHHLPKLSCSSQRSKIGITAEEVEVSKALRSSAAMGTINSPRRIEGRK